MKNKFLGIFLIFIVVLVTLFYVFAVPVTTQQDFVYSDNWYMSDSWYQNNRFLTLDTIFSLFSNAPTFTTPLVFSQLLPRIDNYSNIEILAFFQRLYNSMIGVLDFLVNVVKAIANILSFIVYFIGYFFSGYLPNTSPLPSTYS